MTSEGDMDWQALESLVAWHLEAKTDALVVLGTTGEASSLTLEESETLVRQVVAQVNRQIPVVAGAGTNCTQSTITRVQQVADWGADAALVVTPYYNKPMQRGLLAHFQAVADASACPLILYNVPGRTACDCQVDTVKTLAQHDRIVAIKEASGNMERISQLVGLHSIAVLSGDDATTLEAMKRGAVGAISVTANCAPAIMRDALALALSEKHDEAQALDDRIRVLHEALFIESNPIPVKWALHAMGKLQAGIRLPLTWLETVHQVVLQKHLEACGLV